MTNKKVSFPGFLGLAFLSIVAMISTEYMETIKAFNIPKTIISLTGFIVYGMVILGFGSALRRRLQPGSTNLTLTIMILTGTISVILLATQAILPFKTTGTEILNAFIFVPVFLLPYLTWVFIGNIKKNEKSSLSGAQKTILFWPLILIVLSLTEPIHGLAGFPVLSGIPAANLAGGISFYIFGFMSFKLLFNIKKEEPHTKGAVFSFIFLFLAGLAPLWNTFALAKELPLLKNSLLFTIGVHFIMLYSLYVTGLLPIQNKDRYLLPSMQLPIMLYNSNLEEIGKSKSAPNIDEPTFNYLAEKGIAVYGNWELLFNGIPNGYVVEPSIMKTEMHLNNEWNMLCKEAAELKEAENRAFKKHAFDAVQTSETDENLILLKKINNAAGYQIESIERITASFGSKTEAEQRMALHTMDLLGTFISCISNLCTWEDNCSSKNLLAFIEKSKKGLMPLKAVCKTSIPTSIPMNKKDVLICYSVFEELLEQSITSLNSIEATLKDYPEVRTFSVNIQTRDTFVLAPFSNQLQDLLEGYGNNIGFLNEPIEAGTHGINFILTFKKEVQQ